MEHTAYVTHKAGLSKEVVFHEGGLSREVLRYHCYSCVPVSTILRMRSHRIACWSIVVQCVIERTVGN